MIPEFPRQIDREIHDHEVFMSFNDDFQAQLWHEWWSEQGKAAFQAWAATEVEKLVLGWRQP